MKMQFQAGEVRRWPGDAELSEARPMFGGLEAIDTHGSQERPNGGQIRGHDGDARFNKGPYHGIGSSIYMADQSYTARYQWANLTVWFIQSKSAVSSRSTRKRRRTRVATLALLSYQSRFRVQLCPLLIRTRFLGRG